MLLLFTLTTYFDLKMYRPFKFTKLKTCPTLICINNALLKNINFGCFYPEKFAENILSCHLHHICGQSPLNSWEINFLLQKFSLQNDIYTKLTFVKSINMHQDYKIKVQCMPKNLQIKQRGK